MGRKCSSVIPASIDAVNLGHSSVIPASTDAVSLGASASLVSDSKLVSVDTEATWGNQGLQSGFQEQCCGITGSLPTLARTITENLEAGSALQGTYSLNFDDSCNGQLIDDVNADPDSPNCTQSETLEK